METKQIDPDTCERMFGISDFPETVKRKLAEPFDVGPVMLAMSMLSDAQELIVMSIDPNAGHANRDDRAEQARQNINCAKFVIREHCQAKVSS